MNLRNVFCSLLIPGLLGCLMISWAEGAEVDRGMVDVISRAKDNIGSTHKDALNLASRVRESKKSGDLKQQQESLSRIDRKLARIVEAIPEPYRDGDYMATEPETVWGARLIALAESLDFAVDEAEQVEASTKSLSQLLRDPDYQRNLFVIEDFSGDIQSLLG